MTTADGERSGTGRRVLVAYGSRRGSTREIAEEVGTALEEDGFQVSVFPAAQVHDVTRYDAVVLGGALYMYRWHREARRFARCHALALSGRPVWLFSSGSLDHTADEREIPPVPSAARAARRLDARGHTTFGGRLGPDSPGRLARGMVARGTAGDYRNLEQIRTWAHGIASLLDKEPPTEGKERTPR